jgi:hypothetical protein
MAHLARAASMLLAGVGEISTETRSDDERDRRWPR